jgi:hypothetical protein
VAIFLAIGLLAVLGGLLLTQPRVLEAVRRPLVQWFETRPTPAITPEVAKYRSVAEIQRFFPVRLPAQPPTGYRLVDAAVSQGWPAGPRGALHYQSGDPSDPYQRGAVATLFVRAAADEPFELAPGVTLEPIDLDGLPAYWIAGTSSGYWTTWRQYQGGCVLWEREGWMFALVASDLRQEELLEMAEQLAWQ